MPASKTIKNLLGSGTLLFVATFLVNAANYGLNLLLGRWLGPEGFAEANLIATLVMLLSFAAMGLQLTVAKLSAEKREDLIKLLKQKAGYYSIAISVVLMLLSGIVASYFQVDSVWPFVILFTGVPLYFLMDTEIISFGFLMSFVVTYFYSRLDIRGESISTAGLGKYLSFLAMIALYELSQILINNSDVLIVKHFFENQQAGLYASMALLGRAVFFATWVIVTMLFPKVIAKEQAGEPHLKLFWGALLIVAAMSATMVGFSAFFGKEIMTLAFGVAYAEVAKYLWIYMLFTGIFACANVFVYYNMSLEKYTPVYLSLAFGFSQIVLLYLFHDSIEQVLLVQATLMASMLLAMILFQLTSSYKIISNNEHNRKPELPLNIKTENN